ncbi:unnamed protein product [Eruca vesicaria subsp. sativa]|uniref:Uncharacterized protein n=1 Tax=Eruca vesicaria subsp. sativa TaxID=29727 RepID=A0ABC8IW78_ERUVS|nr:unnamed protein product [Eruca vesicaria subsp. sativa]
METLILTAEHRNQYYGKKTLAHSDGFRSAPSKTFRKINCRVFHYGVGLLPRPSKRTSSTPITKGPLPLPLPHAHSPPSPNSVLPVFDCPRTSPIPIASSRGSRSSSEFFVDKRRSLSYSELWAGPTYSNSPPPTSVPMPKFSLRHKRTVSLSFPAPDPDVDFCEVAKSSPTSCPDYPFHTTVSATMTLRRLLNLETADVE